jgi:predicted nucleotidyltransferase
MMRLTGDKPPEVVMAERNLFPLKELQLHRDLLERASWHFQGDKRVTGLMLWGSIAKGHPDQFSDVDLIAVAPDKQFDDVFSDRDRAAAAIGAPLSHHLANHIPGGETQFMVLYPGPIQLDLTYRRASEMTPDREWASSHIIKDRDGSLLKLKAASEQLLHGGPAGRASADRALELDTKFWNWIWIAHARISRGELWEALHVIDHIRDVALLQLQDWLLGGSLEGYRRLESRLDDDVATKLAQTAAPCAAENLSGALIAEIELYCDLRDRLSARLNLTFDDRAERHVRDAISQPSAKSMPKTNHRGSVAIMKSPR